MNEVDKRVVQMEFDNAKFEKNIDQTIKTLEDFNKVLQLDGATDGFDSVIDGSKDVSKAMMNMAQSVETVQVKFSALQIVGYTVLSELTKTAISVGNKMASAIWDPIISGGMRRSQNIEAAKFQLEGLGKAWNDISDDINYGVKGTAYGLDSAARVAAQLVASGKDAGDVMRYSLRGISGVAAMTNSSYDEIGSIFTTIAGNGKLMTMQLRQLSYRGLNAAAVLADALGKTEEEIYAMTTAGKISFEEFAKAMDDAFGAHAKDANKTFSGAMSNVNAALARVGAKFADPVYSNLRDIFNDLIPIIDAVNISLEPVVNGFSAVANLIKTSFHGLLNEDFAKAMSMLFLDLYSYIRPLIVALTKLGIIGGDLNNVGGKMYSVLQKLQLYGPAAEKVEHFIIGIFGVLKLIYTIIKSIVIILTPIFTAFIKGLGKIFGITGDLGEILYGVSYILSIIIEKLATLLALKIEKALKVIAVIISKINWNTVRKGISAVVIIIGIAIKTIAALGVVVVSVFGWIISSLPVIIKSLSEMSDKVNNIYKAFKSGLSNIFGDKNKTSTVELVTDGFENLSNVDNAKKKFDEFTESIEETNSIIKNPVKGIGNMTKAIKSLGKTSKDSGKQVNDNIKASIKEIDEVSKKVDGVKEKLFDVPLIGGVTKSGETSKSSEIEESVKDSPLIIFFKKVGEIAIFTAKLTVKSILTALGWIADAINSVFPAIGEFINAVFAKLTRFVENTNSIEFLWYTLVASIAGILLSIVNLIFGIGTLLSGLGLAAANRQMEESLKAIVILISSITVFLSVIAAITELVDVERYTQVLDKIGSIADLILRYATAIVIINEAVDLLVAVALITVLKTGGTAAGLVAYFNTALKINAIGGVIRAVALFIGAIFAALVITDRYLPSGDEFDALLVKFSKIVIGAFGSLAIFAIILLAAMALTKQSFATTQTITGQLPTLGGLLGKGDRGQGQGGITTTNPFGALIGLIRWVSVYLAVVILLLKAASKLSSGEIKRGGTVLIGALGALAVFAIILSAELATFKHTNIDRMYDTSSYRSLNTHERSAGSTDSFAGMAMAIRAVTRYLFMIILELKIASKLKTSEIKKGAAVLGGALLALMGLIVVLGLIGTSVDRYSSSEGVREGLVGDKVWDKSSGKKTDKSGLGAIASIIKNITGFLLAITASLVILSTLNGDELKRGIIALSVIMAVLTLTMMGLAWSMKKAKNGKDLKSAFSGMSAMLIAIAAFLAIISNIPLSNITKTRPLLVLVGTFVTVALFMIGMMSAARKVLTTEKMITRFKDIVGTLTKSLAIILGSIAVFFAIVTNIPTKNLSWKRITMIGIMLAGIAIWSALLLKLSKSTKANAINTKAIIAVCSGIAGILLALAGAIAIISVSNLENISDNFTKAVLPMLLLVAGLIAAFIALSYQGQIAAAAVPALIAFAGGLSVFLLAFSLAIAIMSSSDLDKLNGNIHNIEIILWSAIGVFAAIAAAVVLIPGIGGAALTTAAIIMNLIGLFFIEFSASMLVMSAAMNVISNIDADGFYKFMVAFTDGFKYLFNKLGFFNYIELITFSNSLIPLSIGLWALSKVDADGLRETIDALKSLGDTINEGLGGLAVIILAIAAAMIILGATAVAPIVAVVAVVYALIKVLEWLFDIVEKPIKIVFEVLGKGAMWLARLVNKLIPGGYDGEQDVTEGGSWSSSDFGYTDEGLANEVSDNGITFSGQAQEYQSFSEVISDTNDNLEETNNQVVQLTENLDAAAQQASNLDDNLNNISPPMTVEGVDFAPNNVRSAALNNKLLKAASKNFKMDSILGSITTVGYNLKERFAAILKKNESDQLTKTTNDVANAISNAQTKFSNMKKVLDDYGDSITKNIVNKNKEAIESTKSLANSINNSSKSMEGFSKSTESLDKVSDKLRMLKSDPGEVYVPDLTSSSINENVSETGSEDGHTWAGSFAESAYDDLDDLLFGWLPNSGGEAVADLMDSITGGITSKIPSITEILNGNLSSMGSLLGFNSGMNFADIFATITGKATTAELKKQRAALVALIPSYAQYGDIESVNEVRSQISEIDKQIKEMESMSVYNMLGIGDFGDLFKVPSVGTSDYTSGLASDISSSSGEGSGINDATKYSRGGTNINSNNTYNFTQNNYSPEALSRSDLYLQTRAQINAWYGWMRAQPAT